jgi:hypothetical protein
MFTIKQAIPTGRTNSFVVNGNNVVTNVWSVEFAEAPGMMVEVQRGQQAPALGTGMKLDGEVKTGRNGAYFKKAPQQQNNFQGNGSAAAAPGGAKSYGTGYRSNSEDAQKYIIAQCALKCAIEMSKAQEKYDTGFLESAMSVCWELIHKFADRKVDAPPAAPVPQAAPVQFQQPEYAHAVGGNGFGSEEIPF